MILTPYLVKASKIQELPEQRFQHSLNANAVRHTKSIGDWVGLERLGVHLVRVEPGQDTTQFHYHHQEEEFIYILSGQGITTIGEAEYKVGPGDFMGFTAPSQPHSLSNPFDQDLVYLMGGERCSVDICDYPKLQQRLIRNGEDRQLYHWDGRQQLEP